MCSGLSWARQLQWFDRGTFTSVPRVRSQFPRLISLRTSLMAAAGPLPPLHPVPGGPAVCGHTGLGAPPSRLQRGQWKLNRWPQPQAPPCRTQSLKPAPLPDPSPRKWWDSRTDPRLVKRGHRAAEKTLPKGGGNAGAPELRTPGGAGDSLRKDVWSRGHLMLWGGFWAGLGGAGLQISENLRATHSLIFWRRPQTPIRESLIANEFTEIRGVETRVPVNEWRERRVRDKLTTGKGKFS